MIVICPEPGKDEFCTALDGNTTVSPESPTVTVVPDLGAYFIYFYFTHYLATAGILLVPTKGLSANAAKMYVPFVAF